MQTDKFVKFPFKKLTRVEIGSQPGWTPDNTVKLEFPTYRYLWYELCSAPQHPNECYLIVINAKSRPFKGGVWDPERRRYEMMVFGGKEEQFFKLSMLAKLHILQQLPDTCGELDGDKVKKARRLIEIKLKEAFK